MLEHQRVWQNIFSVNRQRYAKPKPATRLLAMLKPQRACQYKRMN
jgi:hypothetical protein